MQRRYRGLWIALGVLVLLIAVGPLVGAAMWGPARVGLYGARPFIGPWFWGFGLGLGLLRAVFWIGLLALVFSLFRRRDRGWRGYDPETPEEIVDRRFAAGEISREEYDAIRSRLANQT
jgi:putative membrane protein